MASSSAGFALCFAADRVILELAVPARVNYDLVAPTYDRRYAEHAYPGIEEALDELVEPGQAVLEVGCGTGHWLDRVDGRHCVAYGVDPSKEMLGRAASRVGAARLARACGEALPFHTSSMDRVLVINALHHFDDPALFAREASRVLTDAGQIAIFGLDPSQRRDDWYVYQYFERTLELDRARYPGVAQIQAWLGDAGFTQTSSRVGHHIHRREPARDYVDRGSLTKESTSQLTLLTDGEFDSGLQAIREDIEQAESRGEQLQLRADLHIYATFGRR